MKHAAIPFLVIVTLLASLGNARAATINPTLNHAASAYAGHPVTVYCSKVDDDADWSSILLSQNAASDADAFADPTTSAAYFRGYDCGEILKWSRGVGDPEEEGELVETFTHEATHLTGIIDEGQTECTAVHNVWRMLRILNPHATTKRLKAAYRGAVSAHNAHTGAYRSVC